MKIRCFRDELQTSFDFIDSRRSQSTQPLSFNRHYIQFVPFSNGIPVDSENIKLWNISYVKLEPWSMLHLTKNQLEKKLIAQKLWKRNCSSKLSLFALLLYSMNMTKYYTDFNMSLLVPIQLLQFLVTLWRDTQHSPELPAVTTSDHTDFTSFILVASKSNKSKIQLNICLKITNLSQLYSSLLYNRIVRLDAEILQLGHYPWPQSSI